MAGLDLILRFSPAFLPLLNNLIGISLKEMDFLVLALLIFFELSPFILLWIYIHYRPKRYTLWNYEKN